MKKLYIVIHHDDDLLTIQQASICAKTKGVHGIFLISHTGQNEEILKQAEIVHDLFPTLEIGVNFLGWSAYDAMKAFAPRQFIRNLWFDSVGVFNGQSSAIADQTSDALKHLNKWSSNPRQIFAGVDFKYQVLDLDPIASCKKLVELGFIPTTSGIATGFAPSKKKLENLSAVAGDNGLAVASGITPENISELAPYLNHILVSTGVSTNFFEIDEAKLVALASKI